MQLTSREAVMAKAAANIVRTTSSGNRLGERLRQLRVAAGMTQTDLAGERFSKEYVSQIERGKTRPTRETIEWLAQKLGVDPGFLERGVSADERRRVETLLARAEALTESSQFEEAIADYENCRTAVLATGVTELEVRHLAGEAWARMETCDRLRADILAWRSRCYRRQRDLEAAREDVERALELAQALDDPRKTAQTYFQASLVSERMGHWVQARNYAERAKAFYEQINDERNVGRLLNKGSDAEAANVVASLAHVHLMTGEAAAAEEEARHALSLMEDREDFLYHVAPTQLVLGRALMEQGRLDEAEELLRASDSSAEQLESIGHQAAAWMARGDLAARRGDDAA